MKKLIIGLVIGLTLGMSTNAFAAIGDTVSAVFAQFNYVVNAQTKTIDSPVLVYEGVSYLRTTDIGNMLGYDVTYKADSRTIEFNKPEPVTTIAPSSTPTPSTPIEPSPTPNVSPVPSPLPTDASGNVIPTPTPDPNATPSPSAAPSTEPTATPSPAPTPTPAPSNAAACQSIRDSYNTQIFNIENSNTNGVDWKVTQLRNQMSAALSSAGCN